MKYLFNATKFIVNHSLIACEMETSVLEVLKRWHGHFVDLFNPYTDTTILGYVITCDDCDLVNDDGSAIDTIKMPKIDMPTNDQQDCVDFQKSMFRGWKIFVPGRNEKNKREYESLWLKAKNDYEKLEVKSVYHNSKKNTTCVVFADDTKIIVKRRKGDSDSVYTAVAYAITQKIYKTNNAFIKLVDKAVKE